MSSPWWKHDGKHRNSVQVFKEGEILTTQLLTVFFKVIINELIYGNNADQTFFLLTQDERGHDAKQNSEICSEHDVLMQYVRKKSCISDVYRKNCSRETGKYEKKHNWILQLSSKHESVAACLCLSCFASCKYLASFLFAECSLESCKVNILLRCVRKSHLWFLCDRFCRWRIFFPLTWFINVFATNTTNSGDKSQLQERQLQGCVRLIHLARPFLVRFQISTAGTRLIYPPLMLNAFVINTHKLYNAYKGGEFRSG